MSDGAVTHIAGVYIQVGGILRQRCAWCGALLMHYDLAAIAAPVGQEGGDWPGTWPIGALVTVDGGLSFIVEHKDGDPLPDGACGKLDPAVTA